MFVHLCGSIGIDSVEEVFANVGAILGPFLKRVPDGEPGGRRLWIGWQYAVLRSSPYLRVERWPGEQAASSFPRLRLGDGVPPGAIRFGELGYAREARASYSDFVAARAQGKLPPHARFQVSLPTPFAVVDLYIAKTSQPDVFRAYEAAMLEEVVALRRAIPASDLCIQWDVCTEMLCWDGRYPAMPPFDEMPRIFAAQFARLCAAVPPEVELGFHLCYGDRDGKHFVDPIDTGRMVELADLIATNTHRAVSYFHLPVPADRCDPAFYRPLDRLQRSSATELYLGLLHAADGTAGAMQRIKAAQNVVGDFGIACECGIGHWKTSSEVLRILRLHAEVVREASLQGK
jgi:hypothetical protein